MASSFNVTFCPGKGQKTVVCISDLHVGSRLAICPPNLSMRQGGVYRPTEAQAALYQQWAKLAADWRGADALVCCGDAIDGQGPKTRGTEQWSTDLEDQLYAAAALIQMFRAKRVYLINGTGYHVDAGGRPLESLLGEIIGAERIGTQGARSAEELFLSAGGKTLHFAHHISIGTGWYKTTPLARELVFALLNESSKHRVDIVIRGHVHYFVGVEFTRQRGYILPCWQLQTRYMLRRSAFAMLPDLGALRFHLRDGNVWLEKRIFKLDESKPQIVNI
jgi:hypothetical protein